MPKIPCRVESGPEGGRRGSRNVTGEGRGLFPAENCPRPAPGPLPAPKNRSQGEHDYGGESREKTDRMTRQAEMEKMWPSLPPFCQRHARHHGSSLLSTACPSGIRFSHSFRSAPAALPPPASHAAPFAFRLSSPVIEGAAWAAYAEGVVPPLLRRAPHSTRDQRGARGAGGLGPRRRPSPDAGQWPSSDGYFTERKRIYSPPASPLKNAKGAGLPKKTGPFIKTGSAQAADASISCRRHKG